MIDSKKAYQQYIAKECGQNSFLKCYILSYLQFQPIKRFLLLLRTSEYYMNCKSGVLNKFFHFFIKYNKYRLGLRLSFTIPENVAQIGLQNVIYFLVYLFGFVKSFINIKTHTDILGPLAWK